MRCWSREVDPYYMKMIDPEYRDASNCYPYQFLEICIPLCNDPIRLIHLNKTPIWKKNSRAWKNLLFYSSYTYKQQELSKQALEKSLLWYAVSCKIFLFNLHVIKIMTWIWHLAINCFIVYYCIFCPSFKMYWFHWHPTTKVDAQNVSMKRLGEFAQKSYRFTNTVSPPLSGTLYRLRSRGDNTFGSVRLSVIALTLEPFDLQSQPSQGQGQPSCQKSWS